MKSYGEIDFLKRTISIEKKSRIISTEKKRNTVVIDRLVALWLLEKRVRTVSIDREKYKVISVHVPYFSDWVILQNDYLPMAGEYFLN
jgi:hypothetical protein